MQKQDHRMYNRAQMDYIRISEGRRATREAVKYYNCAIIMGLYGELGLEPEKIRSFIQSTESIFESINTGALSFKDCIEDVKQNTGIEIFAE